MKQYAFMLLATFMGTVGSFVWSPVYGIAVYYLFAVLRPQFMWDWVILGGMRIDEFEWSRYVAVATLIATVLWRGGMLAPAKVAAPPWYGDLPYSRSHYLFLGFVAWISMTYVTAVSQERAWPYFIEYIKIFVMFICATLVLRSIEDIWLIYLVMIVAAVYIAYEVNFLYLVNSWSILQSRGYGGLDNNGAALVFAMAVPLCFFAWEAVRHWLRWGFLLVIPVLIHAVLLSFSRGAMLSLIMVVPLMWLRTRHKLFVTALLGGLLAISLAMAGKEVQERFLSIGKADMDESAKSRQTTWKIAIRMANERPLFGYGIRNSNLFTYAYGADIPGRTIHSQYLQTAADSGWVALGLYLSLLASVILGLWESRRRLRYWNDPVSQRVKSIAAGLESALLLFCIGAVFLSLEHFELPYIVLLLSMQLCAITRAVVAHHGTGVPPGTTTTPVVTPVNVLPAEPPPQPAGATT